MRNNGRGARETRKGRREAEERRASKAADGGGGGGGGGDGPVVTVSRTHARTPRGGGRKQVGPHRRAEALLQFWLAFRISRIIGGG